jgi:TPR repeat protein
MKLPNLRLLVTIACLGAGYAPGAASQAEAKLAYERGEYQGAREKLLVAANQGDAQAQELLGFMHAFGPQVYPGVTRDLKAATRWFDLAARNGRPVARYMYCALMRRTAEVRLGAQPFCFDHVGDSGEPPVRPAAGR